MQVYGIPAVVLRSDLHLVHVDHGSQVRVSQKDRWVGRVPQSNQRSLLDATSMAVWLLGLASVA